MGFLARNAADSGVGAMVTNCNGKGGLGKTDKTDKTGLRDQLVVVTRMDCRLDSRPVMEGSWTEYLEF